MGLDFILVLLFVDATKSLDTVNFLESFGFLMLLMYHFIIGSHFHNLIT